MNHVNCIVIDKDRKYILYFEPVAVVRVNASKIFNILCNTCNELKEYDALLPSDIGYTFYNRLQRYDNFWQTYILYIYFLIIENTDVKPKDFSSLFNTVITSKNIDYFIYFISDVINKNGINLDNFELNSSQRIDDSMIMKQIKIEEESDGNWLIMEEDHQN